MLRNLNSNVIGIIEIECFKTISVPFCSVFSIVFVTEDGDSRFL
jgi:hypothetical protein